MARKSSTPKDQLTGYPLRFQDVTQGYDVDLAGPEEGAAWIAREVEYWKSRPFATMPQGMTVSDTYQSRLRALRTDNASELEMYLSEGRRLDLVIGQSNFGTALLDVAHGDPIGAATLVVALTKTMQGDVSTVGTDFARAIRASLLVSPTMMAAEGLNAIVAQTKNSMEAVAELREMRRKFSEDFHNTTSRFSRDHEEYTAWMAERQAQLSGFIAETEEDLTRIKDLYHKHVQTEAAAEYWRVRATRSWRAGAGALAAFAVLISAPMLVAYLNLASLKEFLVEIGSTPDGRLSLTPIVAVTVPVLAYAWMLRHVSRLFIQSFAQADDARYRNVMTMTFLGLTKDKSSGVTDAERGIIMNALFRPTPPNTSEDGPPTGLIDLIKGTKP